MKNLKGATLVGTLIAVTILVTTFISALNLQAGIIRAKFFLQYDNIANLLASEGLEIVRAKYITDKTSINNGVYSMDYTQYQTSSCTDSLVDASCALSLGSSGYKLDSSGETFYRFVEISIDSNDIVTIDSTVIIQNPRNGSKQYKLSTKLYEWQ